MRHLMAVLTFPLKINRIDPNERPDQMYSEPIVVWRYN